MVETPEEITYDELFIIGLRVEFDLLYKYGMFWLDENRAVSIGLDNPPNSILVVVDSLMFFDHAARKLAKELKVLFYSGFPVSVLNEIPNLSIYDKKLVIHTKPPRNDEDFGALWSILKAVSKNRNIFLLSEMDASNARSYQVYYDDFMVINPPGESERREILSRVLQVALKTGKITEKELEYAVSITDGFRTYELISFARRLLVTSASPGKKITCSLIEDVYMNFAPGGLVVERKLLPDSDILDQLYLMAVDEDEDKVFRVIRRLNEELPLTVSDQKVLAKYPFLLLDSKEERLRRFFVARNIVRRWRGMLLGRGESAKKH